MLEEGRYWVKITENSDWCIMRFEDEIFTMCEVSSKYYNPKPQKYTVDELYEINGKIEEYTMD